MSGKLVTLINDADLTLAEASVLRVIADFSDDYGEGCWAGYVRLCRNSKLKRRAAIDTVKRLERKGIISVVGKHPVYGTNRWKIHVDKIPMLPPWDTWKAAFTQAHKGGEGNDGVGALDIAGGAPDALPTEIDPGGAPNAPVGCEACALPGASDAPNPEVSTEDTTLDSESPAAEPAGVGEREPWDDDEDKDLPVNLRPSIDDQFARGDEDGAESDERLPQTPLEAKLVSLIGQQGQAKYLGPTVSKARAIRKQLNSLNHKGKFKEVPRDHPSAEDEWKRDPAGFSAYVETCAALIRNESKKNDSDEARVSMDALVSAVRNYGRYKTGWLYYQEALKHSRKVSHPDIDPDHWINRVKAINT